MYGEARWIVSVTASALYAAQLRYQDAHTVDAGLAEALDEPAEQLCGELLALGIAPQRFFASAIPQAAHSGDDPRRLAEIVTAKLLGPDRPDAVAALARGLLPLVGAFREVVPGAINELELRSGPLRSLWEARGPGMLSQVARLTSQDLVAETADILLAKPIIGGGGASYPLENTLLVEAVLTNPFEELPEVVRLGWLWSQLHLDLPKHQDPLGRDRTFEVGALALVMPALIAAQEVELVRDASRLVELALENWKLPPRAEVLRNWWNTYESSRPSWTAALVALDRLLNES
jgi:hypothetical protein